MKKISALLLTLLMNTTATEIKKFKPIDQDEMQTFFRPATPEPGSMARMEQQIEFDEGMVKHINNIFELCFRSKQFDDQLVKGYDLKATSKVVLGTAATLGLGKLILGESTRGMGTELVLGTILGGGLVAGGVYWWIGREMGVITGFKGSLGNLVEELGAMQTIISDLRENHEEMKEKVDMAVSVIEKINQAIPEVVAVAGDNAHLAAILQTVLQKQKEHEKLFIQMLAKLPEQDRELFRKRSLKYAVTKQVIDKVEALTFYNKALPWYKFNKTKFEAIPHKWLETNGYEHLLEIS